MSVRSQVGKRVSGGRSRSRPLCEFAVRGRGSVDPKKFPDETFELFSIPAYDAGAPEQLVGADIGSSKKIVEPGDVLISRIVPHIQRVWVVPPSNGKRQIASGEWILFRGDDVVPEFLRHMLLAKPFHDRFMQTVAGMGGSLVRARPSEVERIEIPVPESREWQSGIAAILDKADGIRRKRERLLEMSDTLLKSVFLDLFGDPATNPKCWPVVTIRDLVTEAKYGTSKKASESEGRHPILRMGNITYSGELQLSDLKFIDLDKSEIDKYTVRKDDILFNRTNSKELVGKTAVFDQATSFAFAGYLIRARTNELADPYYISGYLNSTYGKAVLRSMCKSIIGMANINAQEFQNISIPRPPIELQKRYRSVVDRTKQNLITARAAREQDRELFAALSQLAFRGEL